MYQTIVLYDKIKERGVSIMNREKLDLLESKLLELVEGEIKEIIESTRKNMVVVEEKSDGDSATIADVKIGELFDTLMPKWLEGSLVIQEESFNEEVYNKIKSTKYIWVVDPIDGTKAFRDTTNSEWCVGVALFEDLNPILSLVYIPEPWLGEPYLLSAHDKRDVIYNYGKEFKFNELDATKYVSHIHRDTNRNDTENKIASLFGNNEIIRAYAGHSTLAQFSEVSINKNKVFTRRSANIWDITQAAYLIEKSGGAVYYENGKRIFPLDLNVLEYQDCHLLMPFTIASSIEAKEKILKTIK